MHSLVLALSLLASPALAADAGHFDRDAVVGASAAFRSVSEGSRAALEPREKALTRTDQALADLDLAVALTRGSLDAAQHDLWVARLDERSTRFGDEFAVLQGQLTEMSVGFEQAFEAALARATEALAAGGEPPRECREPKPDLMGGLAQPGGAGAKKPSCPGADRSAEIAAAWDGDAVLKAALDAIDASGFQDVTSYEGEEPALTLGAGAGPMWVNPAALIERLPEAIELVDAVDRRAAEARTALREARAAIPADAPDFEARRAAVVERARGARGWAEDAKAAAGATVWASLERSRKKGKKAGWSTVGVCLNPAGWGGCPGDDVTQEVAEVLLGDKKLSKELAAALTALDAPRVDLP